MELILTITLPELLLLCLLLLLALALRPTFQILTQPPIFLQDLGTILLRLLQQIRLPGLSPRENPITGVATHGNTTSTQTRSSASRNPFTWQQQQQQQQQQQRTQNKWKKTKF